MERLAVAWDPLEAVGYIFGGLTEGLTRLDSVLRYDWNAQSILHLGRLPENRSDEATFWDGPRSRALIVGGRATGDTSISSDILEFLPPGDARRLNATKLPYPVEYAQTVFIDYLDQFYVVSTEGLLRLDPISLHVDQIEVDSWPSQLKFSAAAYVQKLNRVYIIGGRHDTDGTTKQRDEIAYINLGPAVVQPVPPATSEISSLCSDSSPIELEFVVSQYPLPVPMKYASAVYDGQDSIYLIGGESGRVFQYSLHTERIEPFGDFVRYGFGAAMMTSEHIVYFGAGNTTDYDLSGIYTFLWDTRETRFMKYMPRPILYFASTWDQGGMVTYIVGGVNRQEQDYWASDIYRYNVSSFNLELVATLPVGRRGAAAVWDASKEVAYIFGGIHALGSPSLGHDIFRYNTSSGKVEKLQAILPYEVQQTCAMVTSARQAYIVAGTSLGAGLIKFDLDSESAEIIPVSGWPRSLSAMGCTFVSKLNRIYIFGGEGRYEDEEADKLRYEIAYIELGPPPEPSTKATGPSETSTETTQKTSAETKAPHETSETTGADNTSTEFSTEGERGALSVPHIVLIAASASLVIIAFLLAARRIRLNSTRRRVVDQHQIAEFRLGYEGIAPKRKDDEHAPPPSVSNMKIDEIEWGPFDDSFEVSRKKFRVDKARKLGAGEFGNVFAGWLSSGGGKTKQTVAIKVPRRNCPETIFMGLLKELKIMTHLKHENVVSLLGANTARAVYGSIFIIMEFCEEGSIELFMRQKSCYFNSSEGTGMKPQGPGRMAERASHYVDIFSFGFSDLLRWCKEVATGMEFLGSKGVVHRDLAARNVLLTANLTAKISDFGLSRQLYGDPAYLQRSTHQKLPYRWMAIECFDGKFSSQSDVWAYAVLVWEIFSFAELPYADVEVLDLQQFGSLLRQGLRISEAHLATPKIFAKLTECWNSEPCKRPTLTEMKEFFVSESGCRQ